MAAAATPADPRGCCGSGRAADSRQEHRREQRALERALAVAGATARPRFAIF